MAPTPPRLLHYLDLVLCWQGAVGHVWFVKVAEIAIMSMLLILKVLGDVSASLSCSYVNGKEMIGNSGPNSGAGGTVD